MKYEGRICDNCRKAVEDHYSEKGWISFDSNGFRITNQRTLEGEAVIEAYFPVLQYGSGNSSDSLDFCSAKCLLEWMFLSDKTNNKNRSLKEREEFMREMMERSGIKIIEDRKEVY